MDIIGLSSTIVTSSACKAIEFDEITQNKGYYVVPGHSRSPMSFVLSQSTRLTNRRRERPGQYHALHHMQSHSKTY